VGYAIITGIRCASNINEESISWTLLQNLCLDKARESGVHAAQLPIGRFLSHLPTRKVLTVNQVFEILIKWVETRDWELSLYAVIPKRKFQDSAPREPDEDSIVDTAGEGPVL
jgi:tRNA (guanine9-N1)-methyltransferase